MALKDRFQKLAKGEAKLRFDPLANDEARFANLRVSQIEVDPLQPRRDLGDLGELKDSISVHGILQPIVVSPVETKAGEGTGEPGEDRYRIVSGERRFTAATELGLERVPAIVRTVKEAQRLELQIIENLHRKDLHPLEEAMSYRRLIDDFGLTQRVAAERVGKSVAYLNQSLRLLDLSDDAWAAADEKAEISKSVLLEIVKQPPEQHVDLIKRASAGDLTVKQARDPLAPPPKEKNEGAAPAKPAKPDNVWIHSSREGTVTVKMKGKGVPATIDVLTVLTKALEKLSRDL